MPTARFAVPIALAFALGAACALGACGSTQTRTDRSVGTPVAPSSGAEVYVVAMHADWCGACKRLGPEVQQALGDLRGQPVTFVKADLTDTRNPAGKATLEGLGLGGLHEMNGGKTGLVYVVDATDGRVLRRLGGSASSAEIEREIRGAIAEAG